MRRIPAALLLLAVSASPALAHSAARGFVLLLPVGYVIAGGAVAVLASFIVVSLLPPPKPQQAAAVIWHPGRAASLVSAAILVALLWTGFTGPHDPAENLLPLAIWTLWWVVIVLLHPVVGNLWAAVNPFSGLARVLTRGPHCSLPERLGYLPALSIFAAFAWFQLIYPAPEDPPRLAAVIAVYSCLTLVAMVVFGADAWFERGDPFAVFLRQIAAMAPWDIGGAWKARPPGAGLLALPPLPLSGTLFILLTLSSISFDAFANTFVWLAAVGINPLDYPGRTAMMTANTLGLAASFAILAALFLATLLLGRRWAGAPASFAQLGGRLVFSLIPISIAFHFAHYLSDALVNLQFLWSALRELAGLEGLHVTASFQNTASGALVLYSAQTAAIILGHVAAVWVAHAMAAETSPERAMKLEAPLAAFMVAYTAFGLWLLSTPSIG